VPQHFVDLPRLQHLHEGQGSSRDAHFITSRICGICGDNHATCATYAQNMAFGVRPPPIAEWIVNLGEAAEYMFDHNIFQDNLVGVDFCEQMVKETNPGVWDKAQHTPARIPSCTALRPSPRS
jgi:hydrogenase large subunit